MGVELFSYVKAFFCSNKFAYLDADHVCQNTELQCCRTETNPEQLDSSSF